MLKFLAVLSLLVVAFVSAPAQMGLGMEMPKMMTLMLPEVKKELKITKDQDKQLNQSMKEMQKNPSAMMGSGETLMDGVDKDLEAILSPEQYSRLVELWIQHEGPIVLHRKSLRTKLEVSEEQGEKLDAAHVEMQQAVQAIMMKGIRSKGDANKLKAVQDDFGKKALAILTPAQAEKFTAMQGKPFKFKN